MKLGVLSASAAFLLGSVALSGSAVSATPQNNATKAAPKTTPKAKPASKAVAPPAPSASPVPPVVSPPPPALDESLAEARYVSIGSSFAAGPGLPPAKPSWPSRCGQSFNNYPTLLSQRFGAILIDRSCSGAMTQHVLGPWGDVPPQINSVTQDTKLITVTIGGNDLTYIGNLFSATCAFNSRNAVAAGGKPANCAAVRVPTEADYARDEAQMNEIARRLKSMAPRARIVFVQYLTPLPRPGGLCAATPVSEGDAAIVREIGKRLSEITTRVAQAHDIILVPMDKLSADHTPCDKEPWMIGSPHGYDGKQGLQWHLNKAGMTATAEHITAALIKNGVRPIKPDVVLESEDIPQVPAPVATAPAKVPKPVTKRTSNSRQSRSQNATTKK